MTKFFRSFDELKADLLDAIREYESVDFEPVEGWYDTIKTIDVSGTVWARNKAMAESVTDFFYLDNVARQFWRNVHDKSEYLRPRLISPRGKRLVALSDEIRRAYYCSEPMPTIGDAGTIRLIKLTRQAFGLSC